MLDRLFGSFDVRGVLLEALEAAQVWLLHALNALGLSVDVGGQPGWPFRQRFASEVFVIDAGLARHFVLALGSLLLALVLVTASLLLRRARLPCLLISGVLLLIAPWPDFSLVLTAAYPTSFHRSPSGFTPLSIERGFALYQEQCAGCHGKDGEGDGPRAAGLPVWPPLLTGELLWRRAEGDLFWEITRGTRDRDGHETMPGSGQLLSNSQVWALLDAMKVLAAGASVRRGGAWARPVLAPDATVRCARRAKPSRISQLRGQRLRVVALDPALGMPRADPRVLTIALVGLDEAAPPGADCVIDDSLAYTALARVVGTPPDGFAGSQLLVDRAGWLRAYGRPGQATWSKADLLCRSSNLAKDSLPVRDALGDIIASMDADPVEGGPAGLAHKP